MGAIYDFDEEKLIVGVIYSDKEVFEGKPDGWAAILVDGCPLGGGKISGGVCKNHYPKGLRNQR